MISEEQQYVSTLDPKKPQKGSFRWFLVTHNNPTKSLQDTLQEYKADFVCGQIEKAPETQTLHIQACCYFVQAVRCTHFAKFKAHAIGVKNADGPRIRNYCRKEASRIEGPLEYGSFPIGSKTRCYSEAMALCKEGRTLECDPELLIRNLGNLQKLSALFVQPYEHDSVRGTWFYGDPGTGKSFHARAQYPEAYFKAQNKWWDNYKGQSAVILDDLDQGGACLGHLLKIWCDRYACSGEIKGGTVQLQHKAFVITSNYHPSALWPSDPALLAAITRRMTVIRLFADQYTHQLVEFISDRKCTSCVVSSINTCSHL